MCSRASGLFCCCRNMRQSSGTVIESPSRETDLLLSTEQCKLDAGNLKIIRSHDDLDLDYKLSQRAVKVYHKYTSSEYRRIVTNVLKEHELPCLFEKQDVLKGRKKKRSYTTAQTFYDCATVLDNKKKEDPQYSSKIIDVLRKSGQFERFHLQRDLSSRTESLDRVKNWLDTERTFIHCLPASLAIKRPYRVYVCADPISSGFLLEKMLETYHVNKANLGLPDFKLKISSSRLAVMREETFVSYHSTLASALSWAKAGNSDELKHCFMGVAPESSFMPFSLDNIGIAENVAGKAALKVLAMAAKKKALCCNPYVDSSPNRLL